MPEFNAVCTMYHITRVESSTPRRYFIGGPVIMKQVAKKLQSSLAVEGELPEDGLAAYGDDGDDLIMALARKIVSGDEDAEDAETVEQVFAQARDAEASAEEMLVDEGWKLVEVEPETLGVNGNGANGNGHAPAPVYGNGPWTNPAKRSRPSSPGPSSWPRNRPSPRDGTASPSPRPCLSSSGRFTPSRNGRRSRSALGARPHKNGGGRRRRCGGLPRQSIYAGLFCCPKTSRQRMSYWPGPLTVNSSRLDSILPFSVQMAPVALQSVVTGRTTVTVALESGSTVIRQCMLLVYPSPAPSSPSLLPP